MQSSESSKETAAAQTDQACRLLTSTLSSLGADASTLVQLSSLAANVGVKDSANVDTTLVERLMKLDKAVTELESKMKVAREIVTEEKRALASLEASTEQAHQQNKVLKAMLKEASYQKEVKSITLNQNGAANFSSEDQAVEVNENVENHGSRRSTKPRRDSLDPRGSVEEHSIHLERITQEELQTIPRTIRGRISLAVLNDALIDIEDGCRKKYVALTRQRRKQRAWERVDGDGPDNQLWISEQELRQTCAFFRSGESTARAIFFILSSLNRLKQMPAKNGEVIYVLPLLSG